MICVCKLVLVVWFGLVLFVCVCGLLCGGGVCLWFFWWCGESGCGGCCGGICGVCWFWESIMVWIWYVWVLSCCWWWFFVWEGLVLWLYVRVGCYNVVEVVVSCCEVGWLCIVVWGGVCKWFGFFVLRRGDSFFCYCGFGGFCE